MVEVPGKEHAALMVEGWARSQARSEGSVRIYMDSSNTISTTIRQ